MKHAVREQLVVKLFGLGPGWAQRTRTGALQATLVDGVETLDAYVGRYVPQAVAAIVGAAGVTAYLIVIDPLIGAIVAVCAALAPILPGLSDHLFAGLRRAWSASYRSLYAENLDAVQGMATLKAFNASGRRGQDLRRRADLFCQDAVRLVALVVIYTGVIAFLIGTGSAAAVGVGAVHLSEGTISAAALLVVLLLTREAFRPVRDLEKAYHASYAAPPACELIFELLEAKPDVNRPVPDHRTVRQAMPELPGIQFSGVRFTYLERSCAALDGLDLEVAPGERVALVGRSGAGKSTVVSLLLRFFDCTEGTIRVGGADIRDLAVDELRQLVAVVAQDTYLFHASVRHNLQIARADATQPEIEAAASAARAHEFICALPHGYDTIVGDRGMRLSGGQRQRLAIARALLKDAPILILDEATSSVDAANETSIQITLDELTRGRTTLVIAHRLSTVRSADRIVVLDAGRVVEAGAHLDLVELGGAYAELVAAQEGDRR